MKLLRHIPKPKRIFSDKKVDKKQLTAFLNRYSLLLHALLSMLLIFTIEAISRHSIVSAFSFLDKHTWAFAYNSFIIFCSLSLVYLIRRRALARIIISGLWLFFGNCKRLYSFKPCYTVWLY